MDLLRHQNGEDPDEPVIAGSVKVDGRVQRGVVSRTRILAAARLLMIGGTFHPSVASIARAAGCSVRTVFQHYDNVEAVRAAALLSDPTRHAILERILGSDFDQIGAPDGWFDRIVYAAVFGKIA